MAGVDDLIAGWAQGGSVATVLLGAALLGLRHATDPDHVVAVTALVAAGERRSAVRLGTFWGAGHGIALLLFGLPVVIHGTRVSDAVEGAAEIAVAAMIVVVAGRLLVYRPDPTNPRARRTRSPLAAVVIGLIHGTAGSAALGVLVLATIPSRALAVVAMLVLALFTAISMTAVTAGLSATLLAPGRACPYAVYAIGAAGIAFGVWYAAAAL